jgi:hypothetical protein
MPVDQADTAKRSGFGFIWKSLAIVAGIVIIAVAALYIFFPEDEVRKVAQEQAESNLNRDVSIGDVSLSLWPLGIEVSEVVIQNPPGFAGEPFFSLGKLLIDINVAELILSQTVEIDEILIERPRINYMVNPDGTTNVDSLMVVTAEVTEEPEEEEPAVEEGAPGSLPVGFRLNAFRIVDGAVAYRDRQAGMEAVIGRINQFVTVSVDTSLNPIIADGTLNLDDITFEQKGMRIGPVSFSLKHMTRTSVPDDSTRFRIELNVAGIPLAFGGRVYNMSKEPDILVDLNTGRIDLAKMSRTLKGVSPELAEMKLVGAVMMRFHLQSKMNAKKDEIPFAYDGAIALEKIGATIPGLLKPVRNFNASISLDEREIAIKKLGLSLGKADLGLTFSARDYMNLAVEPGKKVSPAMVKFLFTGTTIDISELLPPAPEEIEETPPMKDTDYVVPGVAFPPVVVDGKVRIRKIIFDSIEVDQLTTDLVVKGHRADINVGARLYTGTLAAKTYLSGKDTTDMHYGMSWDIRNIEANDLLSATTKYDNKFYGRVISTAKIDGHGNQFGPLKKNLNGVIRVNSPGGKLVNFKAIKETSKKIAGAVDKVKKGTGTSTLKKMGLDKDEVKYGGMSAEWFIENGKLLVKKLGFGVKGQDWFTDGWISFDGPMDLKSKLTFSEGITRDLASPTASAMSRIRKVTPEDIMRNLNPRNRLRVTIPIRGTTDNPKVGTPDLLSPMKGAAKNAVKGVASAVKKAAEARARAEVSAAKKKAEERARKEAAAAKKKAEDAAKAKAKSEAKKAVKKLKFW